MDLLKAMISPIYLQITRPGTEGQRVTFLVKVYRHDLETGWSENGEGEEFPHSLSLSEMEEAFAIFGRDEQHFTEHGRFIPVEPALCGPAARECADRAEANWRSERIGR